jgi:orotate phosphoribosyltransferase
LARALGIRAIYAERQDGKMTLRRGFAIRPRERILLCEDVVTTGGSLLEVRNVVTAAGGQVVAVASLVDRTSGRDTGLGLPLTALLKVDVPAYAAEECPMCRAGQPLVSPGRTGKK